MTTIAQTSTWFQIAFHISMKELRVQARSRNKFFSDVFSHFLGIAPILLITLALSGSSIGSLQSGASDHLWFVILGYTAFMAFGFGTPLMLYTGMAWAITEEVQVGTIERNFLAPVPRLLVTIGHGAYYIVLYAFHCLSLVALALVLGTGEITLSTGSLSVAAAAVAGLLAFSLGLGVLAAGLYLVVRDGSFFLLVVHRPFLLLSGAIFLIEVLPAPLRVITLANPVTYGIDAFRGALLGRETLLPQWTEIGILFGGAVVALLLGAWLFSWILRGQLKSGNLTKY